MTGRPDSTDRAITRDRIREKARMFNESCGCETPSPGWKPCRYRPLIWGDVPLLLELMRTPVDALRTSTETSARALARKLDHILKEIKAMAVSTDKILADIQTLVAGGQAKDALIKQLQDALASADADKAQAVADAVAADDAGIQAQIDAADAVAQEYLNPPPADSGDGGDTPPADSGDGSAPADGS